MSSKALGVLIRERRRAAFGSFGFVKIGLQDFVAHEMLMRCGRLSSQVE